MQQAVGFAVLRAILGYGRENAFGMVAQHRELHEIGGIEQHVGVFLEGIYPLDLGAAHVRPVGYRLPCAVGPHLGVAHNAAQQPVVARGDAVVVVKGDADDGVNENPELVAFGNLVGQHGIEGVNALHEKQGTFAELEPLPVELPHTGHEIVFGNLDFLAGEQLEHVALQIFVVDRVEVVEIITAVRQFRSVQPVYEIVVGGEGHRMQPAGLELHAQALAESALAAARRSGDQHHPHRLLSQAASVDLLGYLHYLLLLKCFGHKDEIRSLAVQTCVVDVSDIVETHDVVPVYRLGEHVEGLGLFVERGELFGIMPVGHAQYHAAVVRGQTPDLEVAGTGHEAAAVIVGGVPQSVVFYVDVSTGLHELDLVGASEMTENVDSLADLDVVATERQVEPYELLHPGAYGVDVLLVQGRSVRLVNAAEISFRNGPAETRAASREDVSRSLAEQKAQRAAVDIAAAVAAVVHEFDVLVVEHPEHQTLRHIVHLGGKYVAGAVDFEGLEHVEQSRAFLELSVGSGIPAVYP